MLWPGYDLEMLVGDGFLGVPVIKLHTLSLASDLEPQCSLGGSCLEHMLGRMCVPRILGLDCTVGHRAPGGQCPRPAMSGVGRGVLMRRRCGDAFGCDRVDSDRNHGFS